MYLLCFPSRSTTEDSACNAQKDGSTTFWRRQCRDSPYGLSHAGGENLTREPKPKSVSNHFGLHCSKGFPYIYIYIYMYIYIYIYIYIEREREREADPLMRSNLNARNAIFPQRKSGIFQNPILNEPLGCMRPPPDIKPITEIEHNLFCACSGW